MNFLEATIFILGIIFLAILLGVVFILVVDFLRTVYIYVNFRTSHDTEKLLEIYKDLEKRLKYLGAIR